MFWEKFLVLILAVASIWWILTTIRNNKTSFSLENTNKSLYTLGILALVLIVFIALLVFMLKR